MKVVLIGFTVILVVLSCGLAIRYNQDADSARHELDDERYTRMVSEEKLQEADQKVRALSAELKHAHSKIDNMTVVLDQVKAMNGDLRNRLDRASIIQTSLDRRISELQQLVSPL